MYLTIFDVIGLFVALVGLGFVINIFFMWNHLDKSMFKARVFLDDKFLYTNWIYLFLIGSSIAIHQIFTILYNFEFFLLIMPFSLVQIVNISDVFELLCIIFIVLFCYHWYKIMVVCVIKD